MRRKLGLTTAAAEDRTLIQDLLDRMAETGADFTLTFRQFGDDVVPEGLGDWAARWRTRRDSEPGWQALIRATNPAVIPRNHLVEAAIVAAVEREEFSPFEALLAATARPFDDADPAFTTPPLPEQRVTQTFCGT